MKNRDLDDLYKTESNKKWKKFQFTELKTSEKLKKSLQSVYNVRSEYIHS
jgi:hypothetical protein